MECTDRVDDGFLYAMQVIDAEKLTRLGELDILDSTADVPGQVLGDFGPSDPLPLEFWLAPWAVGRACRGYSGGGASGPVSWPLPGPRGAASERGVAVGPF